MDKRFDGPFVIAEILGRSVYRLATPTSTPVKTKANSRDLKASTRDGYWSPKKPQEPRIYLTTSSSPSASAPTMWIAHLHLTTEDRDVVRNDCLNDRVVDAISCWEASSVGSRSPR